MSNFGSILAEERKSRNISQKELANAIGITQAQISYYESGTNEPTIGICIRIADFYGIGLDELFNRNIEQRHTIYNNIHNNEINIRQVIK